MRSVVPSLLCSYYAFGGKVSSKGGHLNICCIGNRAAAVCRHADDAILGEARMAPNPPT